MVHLVFRTKLHAVSDKTRSKIKGKSSAGRTGLPLYRVFRLQDIRALVGKEGDLLMGKEAFWAHRFLLVAWSRVLKGELCGFMN